MTLSVDHHKGTQSKHGCMCDSFKMYFKSGIGYLGHGSPYQRIHIYQRFPLLLLEQFRRGMFIFLMSATLPMANYRSHLIYWYQLKVILHFYNAHCCIDLISTWLWLLDPINKKKYVINCAWKKRKKKITRQSKAQKAKVTVTFLEEQNIWVLAHTLFSLNLASYVSWLLVWTEVIPAFKMQDLEKAVNSELHALSPSDYQNAFEFWRRDWNCVRKRGEGPLLPFLMTCGQH